VSEPRTVTISLPPELAAQVDAAAEAEGRTRSELFREAARQYLQRTQRWEQIFGYGERAARRSGVSSEEEVADAVTELRRARRGR
jgi:CopG family transcriptional regulator/antitoxin EndoAI